MNRYTIAASIVAIAIITGAYLAQPCAECQAASISSIGPYEIDSYYDPTVHTMLDVRTADEYAIETLTENPMNIDFYADDFRDQLDDLDRDASYIVYCRSGNRSSQTVEMMREMGFDNVVHLEGGIEAYAALSQ